MTTNAETPHGQRAAFPETKHGGAGLHGASFAHATDDAQQQRLHSAETVLLVVDCTVCGLLHLHAGAHVHQVLTGDRLACCIGEPQRIRAAA